MRTKKGVVTSAKMQGTVTVTVHRLVFHPVYKKRYRKSKKFLCNPGELDLYPGDVVIISEGKPISKKKRFTVTEIVKAAPRVDEMKEDDAVEKVIHREKKGADEEAKAKSKKVTEGAEGTEVDNTSDTSETSEASVPSQE
ncbi:MAG: 30S ribosomal protein S17 [Candidatus Peregrinibacteria bacterium]|nr:30S ribosomal protein S17 [Candidatus Peregrinibacteria bacterium]MCB9807737.1 30S ribosomal protein S17 [Candidatus Peribacteria bacterium]